MRGIRSPDHRMRDAALLIEPIIRLALHFINAVFRKELRRGTSSGRFRGNGLRPIFTKLRRLAMIVRIRPCATRTIEAIFLIDLEKRLHRALQPHVANAMMRSFVDGCKARRGFVAPAGFRIILVQRRLIPLHARRKMSRRIGRLFLVLLLRRTVFVVGMRRHKYSGRMT
jgi:hypothetical protein